MQESQGINAHIFNLTARWRTEASFTHWLLYFWGYSSQYLLKGKLGELCSLSGCFGKKEISLAIHPIV
jgi:hypothetical protein